MIPQDVSIRTQELKQKISLKHLRVSAIGSSSLTSHHVRSSKTDELQSVVGLRREGYMCGLNFLSVSKVDCVHDLIMEELGSMDALQKELEYKISTKHTSI